MTRFCPSCSSDVEVTQGHCLLGHSVTAEPSQGSLSELRAEVDKAFDEAQVQISGFAPAPKEAAPQPPVKDREAVPVAAGSSGMPSPPPDSRPVQEQWSEKGDSTDPSDPIALFAPPPRMDWGPKHWLRRRSR
jgi:hypothetical protein